MKISENALLATLRVGAWSGRSFGQEEGSGKQYRKRLIAPQFLHEINTVVSTARRIHRQLALPWDSDSTRIVSVAGYPNYDRQMESIQADFEAKVHDFIDRLPKAIKEARKRLGKEFSHEEYPTLEEMAEKFVFYVEYNKVPEGKDFNVKLPEGKTIAQFIDKRVADRVKMAMEDVYLRIHLATANMAEKLIAFQPAQGGDEATGVFRDSLVFNMEKLISSLVTLNITSAPTVHDFRLKMLKLIEYSPEALRTNPKARKEVADLANSFSKKAKYYL